MNKDRVSVSSESRPEKTLHTLIFASLCLILFLIPLPYGSVEEWSIYIFEAATLVLFALHLFNEFRPRKAPQPLSESPLYLKILLAVFFAVMALQIIPLPPSIVKAISPNSYKIQMDAFSVLSASAHSSSPWLPISLSPALTSYELIKFLCYFLFAFLIFAHVRTRREVEIFVWVILAAGLFQSIYGLTEMWGGTGRIFGWKNNYNPGAAKGAFGTYINRDHFSGFLEMIFPLSIGYLLSKANFLVMRSGLTFKEKVLWFSQERLQKTIILGLISVILGLGIIFSRCRSGVLILLTSLFLMSITASASGAKRISRVGEGNDSRLSARHDKRSAKLVRTVTIAVAFLALAIGINPVVSRFTKETVSLENDRAIFYRNTLELTNLFFWTGSGAGTFVHTYPFVEKVESPDLLDHAHDDYLEVLAETGAIAGGALILAVFGMLSYAAARWLKHSAPFVRGIVLGALAGIIALLIHSFLDFNLRIPANAVYFVALCALAFKTVRLHRTAQ